jgi:outer membrane biosynthesis protein TonB
MRTGPSELFNKTLTNALGKTPIREVTEKSLKKPDLDEIEIDEKGGWGSGHFGHSGRPPKVGGSRPGGVKVGRAEMPDYASQFKWSGKDELRTRPGSPKVSVAMRSESLWDYKSESPKEMTKGPTLLASPVQGKKDMVRLEVSGPGVTRKSVDVDFRQLHDLRSKLRWTNTANEHDVTSIGGKDVARGESLEITDEAGNSVVVPVSEQALEEMHHAVKQAVARGEGSISALYENGGQVQKLAKQFANQKDPLEWMDTATIVINGKRQPISLGSRYAILHHYVFDKMSRESIKRRMRANITKNAAEHGGKEGAKAAYNKMLAEYDRVRDEAEKRLTTYSGTQAMVENMELAAAQMFRLVGGSQPRSGRRKKAPKAEKPRAEKPPKAKKPKAEKPRQEAPPKPEKPRAEKPRAEKPRQEAPPKAEKPRQPKAEKPPKEAPKPKAEKPKTDTSDLSDRIQAASGRLSRNMTQEQISSAVSEAEKLLNELKRGKHTRGGALDIAEMRINAASVARETDPGKAQSSLQTAYEMMADSVKSARKSLDAHDLAQAARDLVQAAFAKVLGL